MKEELILWEEFVLILRQHYDAKKKHEESKR